MSTPVRVIVEIGIIILPVLAAMILYIRSENKKRKLYLAVFMAAFLLFGSFGFGGGYGAGNLRQFFRVLTLAVPLYLYLRKTETNKHIKRIAYGIIGLSIFVVFWESFSCSNAGAMPLCGIFTMLVMVPLLISLYFIILLSYAVKIIKNHSALIIQTYHDNKTKILLILFIIVIVISYILYQQSLPRWTATLRYDQKFGFFIDAWGDVTISENPKEGITYDLLHSYENKRVTIYGKSFPEKRNVISATCEKNPKYCPITIIPDKIRLTE